MAKTKQQRRAKRREGLAELANARKLAREAASNELQLVGNAVKSFDSKRPISSAIKAAGAVAAHGIPAVKNKVRAGVAALKGAGKLIFNDLSWYSHYPEIMDGMVGANFARSMDADIPSNVYEPSPGAKVNATGIPRYAGIGVKLVKGSSAKPWVMGVDRIYQSVRRSNSGSTNGIGEQQYFVYLWNMRAVVAALSYAKKIYGCITMYSSVDYDSPADLFATLGLDYLSFKANAADFNNYLRITAERLKTYSALNLDLFKRTEWIFSNIFADSDDAKCQAYTMYPETIDVLQYNADNAEVEIHYDLSKFGSAGNLEYADFLTALDGIITTFVSQPSANIIAGDILKAFGTADLFVFTAPETNYVAPFGYNEEVLTQIQNSTPVGPNISKGGAPWYKLPNNQSFLVDVGHAPSDEQIKAMRTAVLNMYKNDISSAEIIMASRWTAIGNSVDPNSHTPVYRLTVFGTEIIQNIRVQVPAFKDGVKRLDNLYTMHDIDVLSDFGSTEFAWAVFDWMPRLCTTIKYYQPDGLEVRRLRLPLFDYNNYAVITEDQLADYHDIACMSLLYVPLQVKTSSNITTM